MGRSDKFYFFDDPTVEYTIKKAINLEIEDFAKKLKLKYKQKLDEINAIRGSKSGVYVFCIKEQIWEYLKTDKDLRRAFDISSRTRLITKPMVKQVFKDCFNEILDAESNIIEDGVRKTNRMLLAELLIKGVLNDKISDQQIKGLKLIMDYVGEKPASEIIQQGIQQKIIDVNITQEKIQKVKALLNKIGGASILDGFREDFATGGSSKTTGDKGTTETGVSGELERIYNIDVLPDKQD